jgi:DDE superfamily endonuclease
VVDKQSKRIICVANSIGKKHDFRLFKESKTYLHPSIKTQVDTGYQGIQKRHANTELPKKRSKKNPLTEADKMENRRISSSRVLVENVIRSLKIFRIIAEKYRNRRKRFALRLNLISAIHNFQL